MSGIFIVAAKRSPFGAFGGSLSQMSSTDLGTHTTKAALASLSHQVPILSTFFGTVLPSSSPYLARHIALKSGADISTPALTVNRLCGSGFESVIQGAMFLRQNETDSPGVVICGGVENMSTSPFVLAGEHSRFGVKLGSDLKLKDSLWAGLTDDLAGLPMGMTAENLADKYDITREDCDRFAIQSQQRWKKAKDSGHFDAEMAPIELMKKKKTVIVDTDEHPRPETQYEKIAKLPSVFKKDGVVSAANASGICDGSGTILLATESTVERENLTPLARLASFSVTGCDPSIMGIGPVTAIQKALASAGLDSLSQVQRFEVNEAFAAQYLAVEKELGLDPAITNCNGGAISLGHPLGASGSRITAHLANEFSRSTESSKYFVGSACIGGGQGIALVLERA